MAYTYICKGKAAMGSFRLVLQNWLPRAVRSKGAVSPATRAKASMQPVIIPGDAVLTVIASTERQFGTPSARAASRTAFGTISSISSVVRHTVGIIIIPNATPPENAEKCPVKGRKLPLGLTIRAYAATPMTIEGT